MALRTSSGSERSRIPTNVPPTTGPNEDTTGIRDTDAPCFWSRTKLIGSVEGESMQNTVPCTSHYTKRLKSLLVISLHQTNLPRDRAQSWYPSLIMPSPPDLFPRAEFLRRVPFRSPAGNR